jgi:hypothetical protein
MGVSSKVSSGMSSKVSSKVSSTMSFKVPSCKVSSKVSSGVSFKGVLKGVLQVSSREDTLPILFIYQKLYSLIAGSDYSDLNLPVLQWLKIFQ